MSYRVYSSFKDIHLGGLDLLQTYAELALEIINRIRLGELDIEDRLVDAVFIKNKEEEVRSLICKYEQKREFLVNDNSEEAYNPQEYFSNLKLYIQMSEFLSDFSNTILFRSHHLDGRKINTINGKLNPFKDKIISELFNPANMFLTFLYMNCYKHTYHKSDSLEYINAGFIKGVRIIDVVNKHRDNNYVLSIDISKFFENVSLYKVMTQRIFYKMSIDLFPDSDDYNRDEKTFLSRMREEFSCMMNCIFMSLTHNGVIPTGACYSPTLSNIFMLDFDKEIHDSLDNWIKQFKGGGNKYTVTRYVDDITISCHAESIEETGFRFLEILKPIEKLLNSKTLYLKYKKTKTFDRTNGNATILGYALPRYGEKGIRIPAGFRSSLIKEVRSLNPEDEISESLQGKICYYMAYTGFYSVFDIISNTQVAEKEKIFSETFLGPNYKDVIYNLRKSNENLEPVFKLDDVVYLEDVKKITLMLRIIFGSFFYITGISKFEGQYRLTIKSVTTCVQAMTLINTIERLMGVNKRRRVFKQMTIDSSLLASLRLK